MAKTETNSLQQIEQDIKKKKFTPIYLLSGEEAFYIDRITDLIVANGLSEDERDFNLSIRYGSDVKMSVTDMLK